VSGYNALRWAVTLVGVLVWGQAQADWLASHSNSDGSYSTANDLATPVQATSEAVRTLRLLGRGSEVSAADTYLAAQTYHGTEYLARIIVSGAGTGHFNSSLILELLTDQNLDGGFGGQVGSDSTPVDTAFALDALAVSGSTGSAAVGQAVAYLLQAQRNDGSWSDLSGASDVYTTALVARALFAFKTEHGGVSSAAAGASVYLLSQQTAGKSWGTDFLSAQALLTLATISSDPASFQQGATALNAAQLTDGSWSDDVYSTALAMRALLIANQRLSNVTNATGGTIAGYVLSAQSSEPLSNAAVTISGAGLSAQTNASGYFVVAGVPPGSYTVLASLTGYQSASVVAAVQSGQVNTVGPLALAEAGNTAVVRGSVFDASTQLPLAGAAVMLSGSATYSAISGADGTFEVDGIAPGSYTVGFQDAGYSSVTGALTAPAGSVTVVRQGLTPQGTYQDSSPGTIIGQLVDSSTGAPVAGASLTLNGGTSVSSAADGTFSFATVPRGNCQIQASASGYAARNFSFVFSAGQNGNLGSLALYAVTGTSAPSTLTVLGSVVDGVDNHPLSGAAVVVAQTGQTLTTDANGRFTLSGLTALNFNLTISITGYQTASFGGTASSFGQVSGAFALTPGSAGSPATVSTLRGKVTDAATGNPIAGAVLAAAGTTLTTTSAADGSFEIDNIQPLALSLSASAPRYATRTYTIDVSQAGTYALNVQLNALTNTATSRFQVVSLTPVQGSSGANSVQQFTAQIANLQPTAQNTSILADVINASGVTVGTVSPYAPGTTTPTVEVPFGPSAVVTLVVPWNTAQFAPGTYRLALHVIQPGTITKDSPSGTVLAQAETQAVVTPTAAILGQPTFNPPLAQAGATTPVTLSALVINSGNVPLTNARFILTVADPSSSQTLTTLQGTAASIGVGQNALVSFGTWVPTTPGNLPVTVVASDANTRGTLTGTLYVGDKATGAFTVDRTVVPLGNQIVNASINVRGVDVATGRLQRDRCGWRDPLCE
jgi:Carboxypeptidase regulatory-like domain/CarboxypepD_reg-like domain/Prenyltransferase and squalene oxidase repeat